MSKIYKCTECGYELIVGDYTRTVDGRSCSKCGGHRLRDECNDIRTNKDIKPKYNKLSGITIDVSIEGYDKAKQQLRNLEATFDRILEKQEKIKPISNHRGFKSMQIIDDDGKIREIEIDPKPRHTGFDIDELAKELATNMQDTVKAVDKAAKQLGECMKKNCGY